MKHIYVLLLYITFCPLFTQADTYPEVIFDNSLVTGSYAKSRVQYTGKSWVENVNRHLIVSDTLFFTPGNSLSLKYLSSPEGHWKSEIRYSRQKFNYSVSTSDILSLRIYIQSPNTTEKDLPRIYINQWSTVADTIHIGKYVGKLEYGKWLHVQIPCSTFANLNNDESIGSVGFVQGAASLKLNHIFIDQIEFLPKTYSQVKLSTAAVLTEAVAYDKMVHLKWQLPLTPSIRYIKIYRSADGKNFSPITIRPIHMQSCLDIVPVIGRKYYYKIAWVDYNYAESLMSTVKEAQTKELDNTQLLDLIQLSHINYFVENYDINSGMYMPYRSKEKAVVSTKETAGAVLSLIIGAERKFISRQSVYNRLNRIVDYLSNKAYQQYGVFPSYFDGRRNLPEFRKGRQYVDVEATSALIESLLIARQYFAVDNEAEASLRNKITALYDRIDWKQLAMDEQNYILPANIAINEITDRPHRGHIAGANDAVNTYLLALSSNTAALPDSTYFHAVYNVYTHTQYQFNEDFKGIQDIDGLRADSLHDILHQFNVVDTFYTKPILEPVYAYGEKLPLGEYSGSLMNLLKPFLTINPNYFKDDHLDWNVVLTSYVNYSKRRDNELGVGTSNSDIWGFYQYRDSTDNFRINPAISAISIMNDIRIGNAAILALYNQYGHTLFTEYGFRSWLDLRDDDVSDEYLGMNQSGISIAIENARSGLIWDLYEQIPEIRETRQRLFSKETDAND